MVGAVLVHDGRIIGEGYHQQYGKTHAEVNCLNNVAEADKALIPHSTMYVSLEPCAHHGKTPPCANRLVAEGIKKVVICNTDPFADVNGKGIQILKNSSAEVITGVSEKAGRWVNRRFFCSNEYKRPYIILKWAQTQDGFIAPIDNSRLHITNQQSNQLVHKWRTEEDAIMVGHRTALSDNPKLTVRLWEGKNPLRIVTDKNLSLPHSMHLFNTDADTWVLNNVKSETSNNIRLVQFDFQADIIPQLLTKLHKAGKQSLIVEGGAIMLQHFIDAGLWDEARVLTGSASISNGKASPLLKNYTHAYTTAIANDSLNLYINNNSQYPYVNSYDL